MGNEVLVLHAQEMVWGGPMVWFCVAGWYLTIVPYVPHVLACFRGGFGRLVIIMGDEVP